MGVYTNGCGPAFSTSMKLFHTERKSFLPAQAHGLVVSFFWVSFHRCKVFHMFEQCLLHDAHSNGLSQLCLGELLCSLQPFSVKGTQYNIFRWPSQTLVVVWEWLPHHRLPLRPKRNVPQRYLTSIQLGLSNILLATATPLMNS